MPDRQRENDRADVPSLLGELGDVIWLSFPIVVTVMSRVVMQFVDALLLSMYGQGELAAVVPAAMTVMVVGAIIIGVLSCNTTFVSQVLGQGQPRLGSRYTVHAIYAGFLLQLIFLPAIPLAGRIFGFFGHAQEVQVLEVQYFRIRMLHLGSLGVSIACATFFQAVGRPKVPMVAAIVGNAANVFGNWLLIFGNWGLPELGIRGAAIATVAGGYIQAGILLAVFTSWRYHRKYRTRRWLPFEWSMMAQLLRVGVGSGITMLLDIGSFAVFINFVVGRLGGAILAGNNAAMQLLHLAFVPAMGLNVGVTALVGRHIGAGNIPRAKRSAYVGMGLAGGSAVLFGLGFVLFRRQLIGIFSDDPATVRAGGTILCYMALFLISNALAMVSHGALKGAGDTKWPAIMWALVAWLFFVPLGLILGNRAVLGLHGAWLAATLYIWLLDAFLISRFVSERWRHIDIFR